MTERKTILYVEDSRSMQVTARIQLKNAFPDYDFVSSDEGPDVSSRVECGEIKLEEIALVCTDGKLANESKGWDVARFLRARGYSGPMLYTSDTKMPVDKELLYQEIGVAKCGSEFIEAVRRNISR